MSGKLIAEAGSVEGLILSFEEGEEWTIGRDPKQATLVIVDPLVSRQHAKVTKTSEGLLLENISATNPILLNDKELAQGEIIKEGDQIKIGDSWFRFTTHEEPQEKSDDEEEEEPYDTLFGKSEKAIEGPQVDLSQAGRWLLKVISGPNTGAELTLQADQAYLLGTDAATCDIVFHDLSVSRQHARVMVREDENLIIEDLHSRNGVVVGGHVIEGSQTLQGNQVVSLGTTSFVIIDREGVQETLISSAPPPPTPKEPLTPAPEEEQKEQELSKKPKGILSGGTFIFLLIALALVVTATAGTLALFKTTQVEKVPRDYKPEVQKALSNLPGIRYSFNPTTGVLFVQGNVLTNNEKQQMLLNIRALSFITTLKDNVIVDEQVWEEQNALLASNGWQGITVYANEPGRYTVTGYVPTLKKSGELQNWLAINFPYLDKLDYQVVAEDLLSDKVATELISEGFLNVTFTLSEGEVVLSGYISREHMQKFDALIKKLKQIKGVRSVRNFVIATGAGSAYVNLTQKYPITGFVRRDGKVTAVQIGDKIYEVGEMLDGREIISITESGVILEKNGIKYQIKHNL